MLKIIFTVIVAIIISGCTTKFNYANWNIQEYTYKTKGLPSLNSITTINVGESIIDSFYVTQIPAIEVLELSTPTSTYRGTMKIGFEIRPGVYQKTGNDGNEGSFYSSQKPINEFYGNDGKLVKYYCRDGGVYITKNGKINVYWFKDDTDYAYYIPAPNLLIKESSVEHSITPKFMAFLKDWYSDISYNKLMKSYFKNNEIQRSLIYTGSTKDSIFVNFERYHANINEPKFTQSLTYDGGKGKVIGYLGARFEVINSVNTSITYKVLNHLPSSSTIFAPGLRSSKLICD